MFDYTNRDSLKNLKYWLKELDDRVNSHDIVIKIAGNKFDLADKADIRVTDGYIQECLKEFGQDRFEVINTCALTGENVYELFEKIADECYSKLIH